VKILNRKIIFTIYLGLLISQYQMIEIDYVSPVFNGEDNNEEYSLVHTHTIVEENAKDIRLFFGELNLGEESYLIITSLMDGYYQRIDNNSLEKWRNTSMFFNGNSIKIDLYTNFNDISIFYSIEKLYAEFNETLNNDDRNICGEDDRVPYSNKALGRIYPVGCTAWLIENGLFISAGHCHHSSNLSETHWNEQIIEFNVPLSDEFGNIIHPGEEDQYPVGYYVVKGDDWLVFDVQENSISGLHPLDALDGDLPFEIEQPSNITENEIIRISGYGKDGEYQPINNNTDFRDEYNRTLQTSIGPFHSIEGIQLNYTVDTMDGNSGCPIVLESNGNAIGVHTNSACDLNNYNYGTSLMDSKFWEAIQNYSRVTFTNKLYGTNINLGGTLSITNNNANHQSLSIHEFLSGSSIPVFIGDSYSIQTNHFELENILEVGRMTRHYIMNDNYNSFNILQPNFQFQFGISVYDAFFKNQETAIFELSEEINYEFRSPWHITNSEDIDDDWEQPNIFLPIMEMSPDGTMKVFIEHNPYFSGLIPTYSLKIPIYTSKQDGIYEFTEWTGENILFSNPNYEEFPGFIAFDIVFVNEQSEITIGVPLYENKINDNPDYQFIIYNDVSFEINEGSEISFAEGFLFKVDGELIIEKRTDLNSETLETYWRGIEIGDNANIVINGAHFNGMSEGIYRENWGENNFDNATITIKNSIFENNSIGIQHGITYDGQDDCPGEGQINFNIENCTFINSNIIFDYCLCMGCDGNLNNVNGTIINNIFYGADFTYFLTLDPDYGGYNLYYNTDYNFNVLPSDLLDINPNFMDVNSGNYQLSWDNFPVNDQTKSPCIDAGNPTSQFDPDDTHADIGAYYFNQLIGDVNSDGEINILDIPVFVNYILGNPNSNFRFHVFDLNQDGIINVIDVLLLIQLILNQDINITNPSNIYLSGIIEAMENGQRYKYNIDMLNEQDVYILHFELQFDNKIPLNAIKGIRSDEMSVNYNIIADEYKINIMIFSPDGRKIPAGYGTILEIELETTGLGREGELTNGSEFVITDLANNPETLIPVEIVSADELSRLADEKLNYLIPEKFALHPVFPNPFNPIATIRYDLPKETQVSLMVYDLNGRQIATLINSNQTAGIYSVNWHAEHLSSGAYFIKMKTESYTKTQKVILVK